MLNYSQNELDFFRTLIFDHEIRIDGRNNLSIRNYEIVENNIPSCFSSLKILYNNNQNEILFAVKGEIMSANTHQPEKFVYVNIDSMHKFEDIKLKNEIENHIETLLLNKISIDNFKISKICDEFYWKIYVDIYIFDVVKLSLLQLLMIGTKIVIKKIKLPKLILHTNEVTGSREYDLAEVYEDISMNEREFSIEKNIEIPDIYLFAILNNSILIDPSEEEFSIASSIVIISCYKGKITETQSIGSQVDIQKIREITSFIQSLESNE